MDTEVSIPLRLSLDRLQTVELVANLLALGQTVPKEAVGRLADHAALLAEEINRATDPRPDDPAQLLSELIEAVQQRHGRQLVATPDRAGFEAALAALRLGDRSVAVGPGPVYLDIGDRHHTAPEPVAEGHEGVGRVAATEKARAVAAFPRWVTAEEQVVQLGHTPRAGELIRHDGRLLRVAEEPIHEGRAMIVRCKIIDQAGGDPW